MALRGAAGSAAGGRPAIPATRSEAHSDGISAETAAKYEELLPQVQSAVRRTARRYLLSPDEVEELSSYVHLKLLESDGRRLRAFREESSPGTYLTVVVKRLCLDLRIQKHGKWRPSAVARRGGDLHQRIEELLQRQGYSAAEAHQYLRTNLGVEISESEFDAIMAELPSRPERGHEDPERLELLPDRRMSPDSELHQRDEDERRAACRSAWEEFNLALSGEDRLIAALRFLDGHKPSWIAASLRCPISHVYSRVESIKRRARGHFEHAGITPAFLSEQSQ